MKKTNLLNRLQTTEKNVDPEAIYEKAIKAIIASNMGSFVKEDLIQDGVKKGLDVSYYSSIIEIAEKDTDGLKKEKELSKFLKKYKEKKQSKPKKDQEDKLVFNSVDSLQQVVNIINESAIAVNDKTRTITESPLSEVLFGALGAGIGGVGSFVALYGLGTVGLSAAGIMSGLATAGGAVSTVLGGVVSASVAGVFVLALPVAALAGGGVGLAAYLKNKQVNQERIRLYKEALVKHQAIIEELQRENDASRERIDYLQSLNILLTKAVEDLKHDIDLCEKA